MLITRLLRELEFASGCGAQAKSDKPRSLMLASIKARSLLPTSLGLLRQLESRVRFALGRIGRE